MEKEELEFKFIETPKAVFLYFSDGNVITADEQGIVAYSTVKTIFFKSPETVVHSTYISAMDEGVTVWIRPCDVKAKLGLSNDVSLAQAEMIVRTYNIPTKHYDKIKKFIWQQAIDKNWPDD